jgi:serine protease Do
VVVQDFPEESPARQAGVRQGDVITAVNGSAVERVGQFQRLIATRQPGETVTLDLIRYGERRQIRVQLSEAPGQPAQPARPARHAAAGTNGRLGIAVSAVTPELAQRYELKGQVPGVVITQVERMGVGDRANLQEGLRVLAVDGQPVPGVEAFRRAVERKRGGEVVSLRLLLPGGEGTITNIRLPE